MTTTPELLRARPVVVEAMLFDGTPESAAHIVTWAGEHAYYREGELVIRTLDGPHDAAPGETIVKGTIGEFYPIDPRVRAAKYERVGERS